MASVLQSAHPLESFDENFIRRLGVITIAEVGLISLIAVVGLLAVTSLYASKHYKKYHASPTERPLFQPVSVFFIAALITDGVQAIGASLDIRWALRGEVIPGTYCRTQGGARQGGDVGIALFTISISAITYMNAVRCVPLSTTHQNWIVAIVMRLTLYFLFFILGIIPSIIHKRAFYDPTTYWCSIHGLSESKHSEIGLQYIYQWVSVSVSIALYGLLLHRYRRETSAGQRRIRDAIVMGWYPISYVVRILPIFALQFIGLNPDAYTTAVSIYAASSGLINVILWILAGRHFGFGVDDVDNAKTEQIGVEGEEIPLTNQVAARSPVRSRSNGTRSIDSDATTLVD